MSRETAFLLNNVLFVVMALLVLVGTLLPLIFTATSGTTISVGGPWFNRVNVPIAVALLFLMGVGPALPWGAASWPTIRRRFAIPVTLGALAALGAAAVGLTAPVSLLTISLAAFVVSVMTDELLRGARSRSATRDEPIPTATWRLATRNRRRYGGYAVHVGVCVMAVAIAVSSGLARETTVTLSPGESATLAGYVVTNDRLVVEPLASDPRVLETRAEISFDGPQTGTLATALRDYPNSTTAIATPAVRTSLAEDLYVTLLAGDPISGAVTLHVFVNPLVVWIWIGGAFVAASAVFALWPERRLATAAVPALAAAPAPAVEPPAVEPKAVEPTAEGA